MSLAIEPLGAIGIFIISCRIDDCITTTFFVWMDSLFSKSLNLLTTKFKENKAKRSRQHMKHSRYHNAESRLGTACDADTDLVDDKGAADDDGGDGIITIPVPS